ncbi:MAG: hypothetical protein K2Y37_07190 [Pirellulales bacterium]|nr:hypothetical protein [Pirellulales bacterium]
MKRLALALTMFAAAWLAAPSTADAHGTSCSGCKSGCRGYVQGARGFGPYYFTRSGYYAPLNVGPGYGPGFGVGYGFY